MARATTIGMILAYAAESTAGTMPTSGFVKIPEVKSGPSFNGQPELIESTTFEQLKNKTYEPGLRDNSILEFGANYTDALKAAWDTMVSAYETAAASGKAMWFAFLHPSLSECPMWTGTPTKDIPWNETSVNSMLETTLYITPTNDITMQTKPTLAT